MDISYDLSKRAIILRDRGLDIADAGELFTEFHLTRRDDKHSAEEERYQSVGLLDGEVVIVTWTPRDGLRRIVTMWKANERERAKYHEQRGRSG